MDELLPLPINAGISSVGIEALNEEKLITTNDYLLMLDTSDGLNKKIQRNNFQASSAVLSSIENLAYAGNELIYSVSASTFGRSSVSSTGRSLVSQSGTSAMRSYLGLTINTDVQAYSAELKSLANTLPTTVENDFVYKNSSGTYSARNISSYVQTNLFNKTSANEIVNLLSAVSYSSAVDNRLVRFDGTDGTIKSSTATLDNSGNLSGIVNLTLTGTLNNVTTDELSQLENIGATTISATQWGYLGALNQSLTTNADATFNSVSTSGLNMNSNKVINVANPTNANDATNKSYVDALVGTGITALEEARCATTTNLSANYTTAGRGRLTATANGAINIDGVDLSLTDRVLVKDQTTVVQNGIYVVIVEGNESTPYQLERSLDFYSGVQPISNSFVFVTEGTIHINSGWLLQGTVTTIDTDDVDFAQYSASLNAGSALSISGNSYNVSYDDTTIGVNGFDQLEIKAPISITYGGTGVTNFSSGSRVIASNASNTALEATSLDPSNIVDLTSGQTLTNKTMNSATNTITADALHDKTGAKISINNTASALTEYLKVTSLAPLQAEWANITGLDANGIDIHGTTAETTNDNADEIIIYDATAGANRRMTRLNFLTGITSVLPSGNSNVLRVSQDGNGDYTTISAAITASSTGATIFVYPGTYTENITISNELCIHGVLSPCHTIIAGTGTTARVTFAGTGNLQSLTVYCPATGTNPAIDCTGLTSAHIAQLNSVSIHGQGGSGSGVKGAGSGMLKISRDLIHYTGVINNALLEITSGTCLTTNLVTQGGSTIDVVKITGGSTEVLSFLTNDSTDYSSTDLIDISAGSLIFHSSVISTENIPFTNGAHISGDGITLELTASGIFGDTYDVLIDPALTGTGTTFHGTSRFRRERLSFPPAFPQNAIINILFTDDGTLDDPGTVMVGELSVGHPFAPRATHLGEGNSSITGMKVTAYDGTATYVDYTTEASSKTGSTFTAFSSLTAGHLYIGNQIRQFSGIFTDITTALSGGSFIYEYWNGSAWTEFAISTVGATAPYTNYTYNSLHNVEQQNIRFNNAINSTWATIDVNGTTAYWIRLRITSAVTTSPVLQRIKQHVNHSKINTDGFVEYFGNAQPIAHDTQFTEYDLSGSSPSDTTINISTNVTMVVPDKLFVGNALDGRIYQYHYDNNMDTSKALTIRVDWCMADSKTGPVELEILLIKGISQGVNIDNGTLTELSSKQITSIDTDQTGILQQTSFSMSISDISTETNGLIVLRRDARGTNPADDNAGDIKVFGIHVEYTRWR